MATLRKYDANSIQSVREDRDRVRLRPTTYIPSTGKEGAIHIPFEIIDNSIDEITVKGTTGDTVTTIFDIKDRIFTVIDNGSGIPHEALLDACTVLNTSGKFNNGEETAYQFSGGTNGVGLKLAVFLSEWCEITSMRKGKSLTYRFTDGILSEETTGKTRDHGTIVKFKLSNEHVKINDVTADDIIDRYSEKSYLFPKAKMNLLIMNGDKQVSSLEYGGQDIADRTAQWEPDTKIIRASGTVKRNVLENLDDDELARKKIIVDVAFAMKEDALDEETGKYIISYGNTIKTYTGGSHVDGVKEGLVKFFRSEVIPKLPKKDKELQITPTDITSGLCMFVWAQVYHPEFRGQYKDQLMNPEVKYAVRDVVYSTLCEQPSNVISPITQFILRVTRGRMASKKSRKKDVASVFSKDRIDKFEDMTHNTKTVDPELILLEGDSAAGLAITARDPNNQAIYSVKKPKNVFNWDEERIDRVKSTFNDLLDILGIGMGKKCDPTKATMRRVLMLTDGDIDGDGIAISVMALLAKHCKPLIDAGMVGRILPPAYSMPTGKGDNRIYVRSQREFFDTIMRKFIKYVKVGFNGKEMDRKQLYAFIMKNFRYDTKLEALADRQCVNPKMMEYIAWKYHGDATSQKKSYWMAQLKTYDQIRVLMDSGEIILDGEVPGFGYINMAFDVDFDTHVKRFKKLQAENDTISGYSINGVDGMTVYDVIHAFRKYMPKDVKRFKGLGELDAEEMWDLCMDKDKRTVVIMKFEDYESDMEKINVIISTQKQYAEARSSIIGNLTADDIDIDT